jgi:bifunctional non-homologous end joining protein LigD
VGGVAALPRQLAPMLATPAPELPREQERWTFELKWDGIRAIAFVEGGRVRVQTRSLRDVTVSWPELAGLGSAVDQPILLDGEIVALDDQGAPSFQTLQERMHVSNQAEAARLAGEVPATFFVFDVLQIGDRSLLDQPWTERREVLESLDLSGPSWVTTPSFPGEGDVVWEAVEAREMEGVIAKRMDAPYLPGTRSKHWLKIKRLGSDEFVVGGWMPGAGRREGSIGSLLLGVPAADGGLAYVGNVGTGFTSSELSRLEGALGPKRRPTSPFTSGPVPRKGAVFVAPELVVEVVFGQRTRDGVLRHSSYKGMRIDKTAADVDTGGIG